MPPMVGFLTTLVLASIGEFSDAETCDASQDVCTHSLLQRKALGLKESVSEDAVHKEDETKKDATSLHSESGSSDIWCDCGTGQQSVQIYPEGSPGQKQTINVGAGQVNVAFDFAVRRFVFQCSGSNKWHYSSRLSGKSHLWHIRFERHDRDYRCYWSGREAGKVYYEALQETEHNSAEHHKFNKADVSTEMVYADAQGATVNSNSIPAEFAGLWWMDGNPAGIWETVASFGRGQWWPGVEGCRGGTLSSYSSSEASKGVVESPHGLEVPCQGRITFQFSGDSAWAMPDRWDAHVYAVAGTAVNQNMEFICGGPSAENLTVCKLGASQGHVSGFWNNIRKWFLANPFNFFAPFSMVKVSEHSWIRYSFGTAHEYYLKQIVDGDGSPVEPYHSWFLSGGEAVPTKDPDVYGNGGDTRDHVANVPDDLFIIKWP